MLDQTVYTWIIVQQTRQTCFAQRAYCWNNIGAYLELKVNSSFSYCPVLADSPECLGGCDSHQLMRMTGQSSSFVKDGASVKSFRIKYFAFFNNIGIPLAFFASK